MKKAFLVLILISALFIIFPSNIQAVGLINPVSDAFKDFATSISTISRWIRPVAVLLYLAMLLYAGYIRLTAGADPEKAKKAILIIGYSTTGFALIMLAPLIIATIGAIFGIDLLITNPS
ncbi:MAG TPA: hypothetical protein PK863_05355 [Candidatus Dojkabacteria bacterium]|nr:hypothetical protein [Candidatus Dojkabacteria bacterium]HRP37223.1 hypothetical protein [Candidatus Dojkabacteria bacterium]HRP51800.1 hypothetical protein [Candidatus Dojkabacteria bacterium]